MTLNVGVKILLRNKEGKYLIVKRSPDKYASIAIRGSWDAVGGRIVPGLGLIENLRREVKEETDLVIGSEPKLVYVQDIIYKDGIEQKHVVRITYLGDTDGEPVLDNNECVDYKWVTSDELKIQPDLDKYLKEVVDKGLIS